MAKRPMTAAAWRTDIEKCRARLRAIGLFDRPLSAAEELEVDRLALDVEEFAAELRDAEAAERDRQPAIDLSSEEFAAYLIGEDRDDARGRAVAMQGMVVIPGDDGNW